MIDDFLIAVRLALRARFLYLAAGLSLVVLLVSYFSATFSGRQPATVALDMGISTIRLCFPLLIVLLVQEIIFREFDRRHYLCSLAYPRARSSFLFARFAALFLLVLGLFALQGALLAVLVGLISEGYAQSTSVDLGLGYLIVLGFLALDLLVLVSISVFLAVVSSTSSFVLIGALGFALVARSYGSIVALLSREQGLVGGGEFYRSGLGFLRYVLPDLGALDLRMVALYGELRFVPGDWLSLLFGSFSYVIALLIVSVWFLERKRFV